MGDAVDADGEGGEFSDIPMNAVLAASTTTSLAVAQSDDLTLQETRHTSKHSIRGSAVNANATPADTVLIAPARSRHGARSQTQAQARSGRKGAAFGSSSSSSANFGPGSSSTGEMSASETLRALAEEAQAPPTPWYVTFTDNRAHMFMGVLVCAVVLLLLLRPQFVLTHDKQGRVCVSIVKLFAWSACAAGIAFAIPYALPALSLSSYSPSSQADSLPVAVAVAKE